MSKRSRQRKRERIKPKPRPENAIILTKKSVAKSQLETAISLWFQNADPVSILVLAFNAHEILQALVKKDRKPSQLQDWLDTFPERFRVQWRYVWNFCKHGFKDLEEDTPYDPRQAEVLIFFSCLCYRDVFGKRTPLMLAFDFRLSVENPETVDWAAVDWSAVPIPELSEAYRTAVDMSRPEFFHHILDMISSGRFPPTSVT